MDFKAHGAYTSDFKAHGVYTKSIFLKSRRLRWQLLCRTRASGAVVGAGTVRAFGVAVRVPLLTTPSPGGLSDCVTCRPHSRISSVPLGGKPRNYPFSFLTTPITSVTLPPPPHYSTHTLPVLSVGLLSQGDVELRSFPHPSLLTH